MNSSDGNYPYSFNSVFLECVLLPGACNYQYAVIH